MALIIINMVILSSEFSVQLPGRMCAALSTLAANLQSPRFANGTARPSQSLYRLQTSGTYVDKESNLEQNTRSTGTQWQALGRWMA